jgi:hypothetical protein
MEGVAKEARRRTAAQRAKNEDGLGEEGMSRSYDVVNDSQSAGRTRYIWEDSQRPFVPADYAEQEDEIETFRKMNNANNLHARNTMDIGVGVALLMCGTPP